MGILKIDVGDLNFLLHVTFGVDVGYCLTLGFIQHLP